MIGKKLGNVTDWFVSAFGPGDFLAKHNDGSLGSIAFILHLAKDWDPLAGGGLRFILRGKRATLPLSFNTLSLFYVGGRHPPMPHEVM